MASLVSVSNAFHGFTLETDFICHETRKQAHEISPDDLIPGVQMMG